ncbi:hypothetical protein ANCCAN_28386, partial [Ancylostoma caninum]
MRRARVPLVCTDSSLELKWTCSSHHCNKDSKALSVLQGAPVQIGVDGILSASIALGNRLQLFQALAKVSSEENPATPAQVAKESGCKERYVKEWLSVMAAGDLITVTEDEKFYIKKEHIADLTGGMSV